MTEQELKKYQALNRLAEAHGTVILGGDGDLDIPLCELKQAFGLEDSLYNRSLRGLRAGEAAEAYDACVRELTPDTVLIHLGAADLAGFDADSTAFDNAVRELIAHIRADNKDCRIGIVSLRGKEAEALNRHLKYLADGEQCEFHDIAAARLWNPQGTREVMSFVGASGFGRRARKASLYDLVKILFCCEDACIA